MAQKITVAHLKFNYYAKKDNKRSTPLELTEGYYMISIPGEGKEVQEKMRMAIINYGEKLGLFDIKTITQEEYESNKQIQK
jgi:hypothetical protein